MSTHSPPRDIIVRKLGLSDYFQTWQAMRSFTAERGAYSRDEIWLLQHPPIYTLGLNGKNKTRPALDNIPFVHGDRGGDITYHGPGQLVAYLLMDLRRRSLGVKALVAALEQAVIDLLNTFNLTGVRRKGAPGVYVENKKIAALGLRIRNGCSYHGLALNVSMDLTPFEYIAPCGYAGLEVTQLADLGVACDMETISAALSAQLLNNLGYNAASCKATGSIHESRSG
ncbi:MAG TPA: lipoyl(octanoyl) transferase LipB [Acidiferrobacterales bacterium]|nr:lipoyl(octanoyl) transferase LipB [Acidiferrobacterales bacterium]